MTRSIPRSRRARVVLAAGAAVVTLAATACTSTAPDSTTTTGAGASRSSYADAPCPKPNIPGIPEYDFPANARCGYLTVPENRSIPNGRTIKVFVLRIPAFASTPKPDPVVVLSGGPGGGGSFEFSGRIKAGMNADRDVIFVDQRGTHLSQPLLGCPEYDEAVNRAQSILFTSPAATEADVAAVKTCRDRFAAQGVDLSAYNTAENAADIADLRVALGIESWNLFGTSYGTKLALVTLRDHPQGIRTVTLDSVSPPNLNIAKEWWSAPAQSFAGIFAGCKAQPACAAAYPTLDADFYATVKRLDANPVVVETKDASGAPMTLNIGAFAFVYTVVDGSEHGDPTILPKLIWEMSHGNPDLVVKAMLAERTPPQIVGLGGHGLAFTVFCGEAANLTSAQDALAFSKSVLPEMPDSVLTMQPKQGRLFQECPVWDVSDAAPAMMTPVTSTIPTLILEGEIDAATAPSWVRLVTPGLQGDQFVTFPLLGHSVYGKSPCSVKILAGFLNNPTQQVDRSCVNQEPRPFVTS
ncbi:MAG TPA: alpha/beta hydrolase [Lapillicoccus sp.]|nr:alpha/beta hydrolase [Lapillicoccus sp.]